MLRASSEVEGEAADLRAVTDGKAASDSGVAHAEELVGFAEAAFGRDDLALAGARRTLLDALGPEALVDSAAVVGNFQRMVRIADSTGIPLDGSLDVISEDVRDELDLGRFGSSVNTPKSALRSAAGRLVRPIFHGILKAVAMRRRPHA